MNNEKSSTAKLVESLAQEHHLSKTAASTFLKQMTAALAEGLLQDGELRIKGLGLFKIEWVESRISNNVHKGEKQEISGHNRISFIPDKTLREKVNAPFAHLETVSLDDTEEANADAWLDDEEQRMKRFSEQAQEILSIISDLQEINPENDKESSSIPNEQAKTVAANNPENKSEQVISSITVTNSPEEAPTPQPMSKPESTSEKMSDKATPAPPSTEPYDEIHLLERMSRQSPKKNKRWLLISILVALIVVICIPIYYVLFLTNHSQQLMNKNVKQRNESTALINKTNNAAKSLQAAPVNQSSSAVANPLTQPRTYKDTLAVVTFQEGSRLTLLSLKYYGNKIFWVYIYEANKNKIENPDQIGAGMRMMIPKLNPGLIDVNNPQCINQAKALQIKYTQHALIKK
ncbi:MAG: HU family DNA-binding protein [Microbacter sp.]